MTWKAPFRDRAEAGRQLAGRLMHLRGRNVVVLGLPRGGVPVAATVAAELAAPLDVIVVRKLGVPFQPELAMGAVGEGGALALNRGILAMAGVGRDALAAAEERERAEVARRARRFRGDRPRVPLEGRIAVVVDDGIATGATARAACAVARAQGATSVVLAVPVCSPRAERGLRGEVDEMVVLDAPVDFFAVGQAYDDFRPVADEEVEAILGAAGSATHPEPDAAVVDVEDCPVRDEEVVVPAGRVRLPGRITVPDDARGLVVFAHGSGSSRHSSRNHQVAHVLQDAGLATLLFDLLAPDEEADRENVFAIDLLAERLEAAVTWVRTQPGCRSLPLGFFGASTGAAAALWAAADPRADVAAVVSRGGRPDLAGPRLERVRAATLLVVGGADDVVLALNEAAARRLRCEHRLVVVPGATHLFEEPGTLGAAAEAARDWFVTHFTRVLKRSG